MELKKQGQILALFLDERLIDHKIVVSWIDGVIQKSDNPEKWMTEISLSKKEDTDRVVYLFWTHFGYEYSWSFTEYVALNTYQYQKNDLPLYKSLTRLHHLSKVFHPANPNGDSEEYKQKISYLFDILHTNDYKEWSIELVEKEFEILKRYAQEKHHNSIHFTNNLIEQHSKNIYDPLLGNPYCHAKLQ